MSKDLLKLQKLGGKSCLTGDKHEIALAANN